MTFKNHPRTFVEVYVDGRISTFTPDSPKSRRDMFAITLIAFTVKANSDLFSKNLETGRYEIFLNKFSLLKRIGSYEMKPV